MKEILLLKYGEVALKGLNKPAFESAMLKTVRRRLADIGEFRVYKAQSTIYVEPLEEKADLDAALCRVQRIFGFSAINRAAGAPSITRWSKVRDRPMAG